MTLSAHDIRQNLSNSQQEFLVFIGHTLNELSFLAKALIAAPQQAGSDPEAIAKLMHRLFYSRMIISKCHEVNIDIGIFRGKNQNIFETNNIKDAAKDLNSFLSQHGKSISALRNVADLHNPRKQFASHGVFDAFDTAYKFEIYLAQESGSTLYAISEMPLPHILRHELSNGLDILSFEESIDHIQEMALGSLRHVRTLGERIIGKLLTIAKRGAFERETASVSASKYSDLFLPFFCEK